MMLRMRGERRIRGIEKEREELKMKVKVKFCTSISNFNFVVESQKRNKKKWKLYLWNNMEGKKFPRFNHTN